VNAALVIYMTLLSASVGDNKPASSEGSVSLRVDEQGALLREGKPCRVVGINFFSAFSRTLENADDHTYREGFVELKKRGIPFVRFMACGFWPKDWQLYFDNKEEYFRRMDAVVKSAEEVGMGLIPSLFWYNATVPDLVGEPRNQWGNHDSKTIAFMRNYTREVVTRYRQSPAIWAWEFGNEYSLEADLPNAAEHRPWVYPSLGTPETRSEADDLIHDIIVTASRLFAEEVRRHDALRPVTTGHSLPRPTAEHLRRGLGWHQDSTEEFRRNLIDVNPDPCDLVSVHVYPFDRVHRFGQPLIAYEKILNESMQAVGSVRKALFVGEFGSPDDEKHGGKKRAQNEIYAQLTAIERSGVPIAALWNYDLPSQEADINISLTNHRSYLLNVLGQTNRRLALFQSGVHAAELRGTGLTGRLLDNAANEDRQGSGFNPLCHELYPGENLFRGDAVGLNFEHIFNGTAKDRSRSMFTPRRDVCLFENLSDRSATLHWPAKDSSWGMECKMSYTIGENVVDMVFTCVPERDEFPLGYVALMWASYMNHTRDRKIYFYGINEGKEGWVAFGEDTDGGFERGTLLHRNAQPLPFEDGAETLNVIEHPSKRFTLPFYYGLIDGDGNQETKEDTLAYIMMFDQAEPIRFALWNFISDENGNPDIHSPAWDWQYVIRNPEPGKTYSYRARLAVVPFTSAEDVRAEYDRWVSSLSAEH